jgi:hypothetical protein
MDLRSGTEIDWNTTFRLALVNGQMILVTSDGRPVDFAVTTRDVSVNTTSTSGTDQQQQASVPTAVAVMPSQLANDVNTRTTLGPDRNAEPVFHWPLNETPGGLRLRNAIAESEASLQRNPRTYSPTSPSFGHRSYVATFGNTEFYPAVEINQASHRPPLGEVQADAGSDIENNPISREDYTKSLKPLLESLECSICKEPYAEGHMPTKLPECGHVFGDSCIVLWLGSNSSLYDANTCPMCREVLFELEELSNSDEEDAQEDEEVQAALLNSVAAGQGNDAQETQNQEEEPSARTSEQQYESAVLPTEDNMIGLNLVTPTTQNWEFNNWVRSLRPNLTSDHPGEPPAQEVAGQSILPIVASPTLPYIEEQVVAQSSVDGPIVEPSRSTNTSPVRPLSSNSGSLNSSFFDIDDIISDQGSDMTPDTPYTFTSSQHWTIVDPPEWIGDELVNAWRERIGHRPFEFYGPLH